MSDGVPYKFFLFSRGFWSVMIPLILALWGVLRFFFPDLPMLNPAALDEFATLFLGLASFFAYKTRFGSPDNATITIVPTTFRRDA